jgi:hypothetical protein
VALLDLTDSNPWSRVTNSRHKSVAGVRKWVGTFVERARRRDAKGIISAECGEEVETHFSPLKSDEAEAAAEFAAADDDADADAAAAASSAKSSANRSRSPRVARRRRAGSSSPRGGGGGGGGGGRGSVRGGGGVGGSSSRQQQAGTVVGASTAERRRERARLKAAGPGGGRSVQQPMVRGAGGAVGARRREARRSEAAADPTAGTGVAAAVAAVGSPQPRGTPREAAAVMMRARGGAAAAQRLTPTGGRRTRSPAVGHSEVDGFGQGRGLTLSGKGLDGVGPGGLSGNWLPGVPKQGPARHPMAARCAGSLSISCDTATDR